MFTACPGNLALDYIGGVYIHVYRNLLGWLPQPETHTKQFLQLANHSRRMVKHMKPWRIAFKNELYIILKYIERENLQNESKIDQKCKSHVHFFQYSSGLFF